MNPSTHPGHWTKLLVTTACLALIATGAASVAPAVAQPNHRVSATALSHTSLSHTALSAQSKKKKTKITAQPKAASLSRYGTRTTAKFSVKAKGTKLRYTWQAQQPAGGAWRTVKKGKSASYTATGSWANGTKFRVIVSGKKGKATSKTARLSVLLPSTTPAADAQKAFGLTGLTQGIDLSSWQYMPGARANVATIAAWARSGGFLLLRNGSGSRPINVGYTDACTGAAKVSSSVPVIEDCAYPTFADSASAAGVRTGHYWFNGWIASNDTSGSQAFAGGYTPEASAQQFVAWLLRDGNYTPASTDPLVLDIEAGNTWTKVVNGTKVTRKLRAWNSAEALAYLNTVKTLLTNKGYHANLYVYMGSNNASRTSAGSYVWRDVAAVARLWVASWGADNGRIPATQPAVGPWTSEGWSIWQYTSNARIDGSGVGALDGDIARATAWTPR